MTVQYTQEKWGVYAVMTLPELWVNEMQTKTNFTKHTVKFFWAIIYRKRQTETHYQTH